MLKKNKNPYAWENLVAMGVVGIFCIFGLISWIITSDYALDLKFSETLDQIMDNKFVKFWTMFRVLDGFEGVITFVFPMGYIIVESFLLAMKKARPHGWFAHYHTTSVWVYLLMSSGWTAGVTLRSVTFFFGDQGFGRGYWYWFETGWSYLIPGFILSLTIQLTYLWTATWYVHWKLARRHDFLANQYWKRACIALLSIAFIYIPVLILKIGFGRPYLYNIRFGDLFAKMQTQAPERFAHYLDQSPTTWSRNAGFNPDPYTDEQLKTLFGERYYQYVENQRQLVQTWVDNWNQNHSDDQIAINNHYYFNFPENSSRDIFNNPRVGWNYFASNQTYPWFKATGQGNWNGDNNLLATSIPDEGAFPSGHMVATFGICLTVYLFKDDPDKRVVKGRRIGFVLALIFYLDMFFSLAVSLSHWWSDLGFSMFWTGIGILFAQISMILISKFLILPVFKWVQGGRDNPYGSISQLVESENSLFL